MSDDQLNELFNEKLSLEKKIKERKKEIAKERGLIFGSIEELVCQEHPNSHFTIKGKIEGSIRYGKGFNIYECELCKDNKNIFFKSKAYDCSNCGIVLGNFEIKPYKSPPEDWMRLSVREGEQYFCRICETKLGELYYRIS